MALDPEAEQDEIDRRRALELFTKVKDAVGAVLDGPVGATFLEWLSIKAFAHRSTFHANDRLHCYREGMRGLYLEIAKFSKLTPDELLRVSERKHLR